MTTRSQALTKLSFSMLAALALGCSSSVTSGGDGGGGSGGSKEEAPACPTDAPEDGAKCSGEASCTYQTQGSACPNGLDKATCKGGKWSVIFDGSNCPPETSCPATPPTAGAACGPVSQNPTCSYMVPTHCGGDETMTFVCVGVWQLQSETSCSSEGCSGLGEAACNANTTCRYLAPGCDGGMMMQQVTEGCYPAADCSVEPSACSDGQTCTEVEINPCEGKKCDECSGTTHVCSG